MPDFPYSRPDGCRDHDAASTHQRREIEEGLLAIFRRYGYAEVTVPSLEYNDLYHQNRIGRDLYYRLMTTRISDAELFPADDGAIADARLAHRTAEAVLRPELTAPLARLFCGGLLDGGAPAYLPARFAYAGQIFRNVDPAPERLREFRQVGVELIGSEAPYGDLELLCLACDATRAVGLSDWRLHLGHARLYREILRARGLDGARLAQVASNIEIAARILRKAEAADDVFLEYVRGFLRAFPARLPLGHPGAGDPGGLSAEAWRAELPRLHDAYLRHLWSGPEHGLDASLIDDLLALTRLGGEPASFFDGIAPFTTSDDAKSVVADLRWLCDWLERERGVTPVLTPAANRGLAYYTGLTFEIHCPLGASPYTDVCGGGRYDDLHGWVYQRMLATQELRGTRAAPPIKEAARFLNGVGFAFGVERLAAALAVASARREPAPGARVFVAVLDPALFAAAFAFADALRRDGISVECHLPTPRSGVGAREQIGHADRLGARAAVLFGPDEWAHGAVALRDLGRRVQENVPLADAPAAVRALLEN